MTGTPLTSGEGGWGEGVSLVFRWDVWIWGLDEGRGGQMRGGEVEGGGDKHRRQA
jgi:hypothetical protein